jgi:hypothetical protein
MVNADRLRVLGNVRHHLWRCFVSLRFFQLDLAAQTDVPYSHPGKAL